MTEPTATIGTGPVSLDTVRRAVEAYADNPAAFLALNSGNSYFCVPGLAGVVAYRESGRYLVQFAGPFAPAASYRPLLDGFVAHARARRRKVVAIQLQHADAVAYREQGFVVNQIGASYAVDLSSFSLRGSRFMQLRNKVSRAARAGLTVYEVDQRDWASRMAELDGRWLRGKGKHAKPLEFLVGEYGGPVQPYRRLFVGVQDSTLLGYISYAPVPGGRPGWLHDLSRRLPEGPPGVSEAINLAAIEAFRAEGCGWLHFGFTPFTGLGPGLEVPGASRPFGWLVSQLGRRGAAVYPAATQLAYKLKWGPQAVIPEYIAFSARASLTGFLQVFKVSNAL